MVKQTYEIPTDIMADAARIILQAGLAHRLVDAGKESVKIELLFPDGSMKAKQSMEEMINDYNFFRFGDNE